MSLDFFAFSRHVVDADTAAGRFDAAHNRAAATRCLEQFSDKESLPLDALSPEMMLRFKQWLMANGRKESTALLYLNQISAIYNVAVKEGLAPRTRLLQGIRAVMPAKQTRKLLSEEELRRMRYADFSSSRPMSFARDMFLFSIYGRGISFTDMAYIKKSDVQGEYLTYTSQTIGQPRITIPWDEAMQEIADRYPSSTTDYLLSIIKSDEDLLAHRDVKYVRENIVRGLKQIASHCHLSVIPSMYMVKDIYRNIVSNVCVSRII